MTLHSLAEWLRCPTCGRPLTARPPLALLCAAGHSHDTNKRGYLNSVVSPGRFLGDAAAMLDARSRILGSGSYAPVADAIGALTTPHQSAPDDGGADDGGGVDLGRVVDIGCGTGYYLTSLLKSRPGGNALAVDLSPAAVARTVRAAFSPDGPVVGGVVVDGPVVDGVVDRPVIDGLVADVWQPLAIRDGAASVILSVFAPRNPREFHRILAPDGSLIVVTPRAAHLHELQEAGLALEVPAGKSERLVANLHGLFTLVDERSVEFGIALTDDLVGDLIGMGPSAHHRPDAAAPAAVTMPAYATASVDALLFRRSA